MFAKFQSIPASRKQKILDDVNLDISIALDPYGWCKELNTAELERVVSHLSDILSSESMSQIYCLLGNGLKTCDPEWKATGYIEFLVRLGSITQELGELIHAYLICPSSSCSAERGFSYGKYILSDRRSMLSTENLELMTKMYANKDWKISDMHEENMLNNPNFFEADVLSLLEESNSDGSEDPIPVIDLKNPEKYISAYN